MADEKRLIDAEALKRAFRTDKGAYALRHCISNLFSLDEIVDEAPTVDAVEVVRCKDCEHCIFNDDYNEWECVRCAEFNDETGQWYGISEFVEEEHFCSYGERKDNG